jgi:hypothetical protein
VPPGRFRRSLPAIVFALLGGLVGTDVMFALVALALYATGVPTGGWPKELFLAFGGPLAGSPEPWGPGALLVHYAHGILLGGAFGILWAAWGAIDPRLWRPVRTLAAGLGFGAVLSAGVLALLWASAAPQVTAELAVLVVLIHLAFGGVIGGLVALGTR